MDGDDLGPRKRPTTSAKDEWAVKKDERKEKNEGRGKRVQVEQVGGESRKNSRVTLRGGWRSQKCAYFPTELAGEPSFTLLGLRGIVCCSSCAKVFRLGATVCTATDKVRDVAILKTEPKEQPRLNDKAPHHQIRAGQS
jgi:hypothetical protein